MGLPCRRPQTPSLPVHRIRNALLLAVLLLGLIGILHDFPLRLERSLSVNLFGKPKVAFLFLTAKQLPLDFLWDHFFKGADPNKPYSIYIHGKPGVAFNATNTKCSAFHNRQIPDPVMVEWGQLSMVEAERRLLRHALQDPLNHRFILVSDTCLFLHDYDYVYDYVMVSQKSFVDSFRDTESNVKHRYNPAMAPTVQREHWRKGSQWFVLIRKHAEAVVEDKELFEVFRQHCQRVVIPEVAAGEANLRPASTWHQPDCIPDEHYVQTLLAMRGLEQQLERRTLTYSHWRDFDWRRDQKGWHPTTFDLPEATPMLINSLQRIDRINFQSEGRTEYCGTQSLPQPCFLFARKFTRAAGVRIVKRMSKQLGLKNVGDVSGVI